MTANDPLYKHKPASVNLKRRIISAAVLIPPVIGCVYAGGFVYAALVMLLISVCAFEWYSITMQPKLLESKFSAQQWQAHGALLFAFSGAALIALRHFPDGIFHCLFLAVTVWGTDIGAMAAGKTIGGPKLCPKISPNKTWAGLLGGMVLSCTGAFLLQHFIEGSAFLPAGTVLLACLMTVVAQAGDLYESWLKRVFGVKDSGTIIPGHGGALDRVDGLLTAALFYYIVLFIAGYL